VKKMTSLVNIFDREAFEKELEQLEGKNAGSKADTIAHRTKRTINERMDDDPAFYAKFSKMLEDAIAAFQQKRLADIEYLNQVQDIAEKIRTRSGDNLPSDLRGHEVAGALYGVLKEVFQSHADSELDLPTIGAAASLRIDDIVKTYRIVNWTNNLDVQNQMQTAIEDYLHELEGTGLDLSFDEIDMILEKCLDIARRRYA